MYIKDQEAEILQEKVKHTKKSLVLENILIQYTA